LPLRPVLTQHLPGRFCKEFLVLAAVALFVVLSSAVRAQGLGSVSGSITDTTGAAIPGASVTIKQTEKNLPTAIRADASGVYSFPALPPAAYGLKVVAPGFQTYTQ
jgi:hypothetical protein